MTPSSDLRPLPTATVTTTSSASLPVVFCDGNRQIEVGSVSVHPTLGFKKFQDAVANRIGVAPHQISSSLVRRKKARPSPDIRRKVPIDDSTDFAAMSKERDCFVLAVLRRSSRRDRRSRSHRSARSAGDDEAKKSTAAPPPVPEKLILRRNQGLSAADPMIGGALGLGLGFWDYGSQLRDLQRQRDLYRMSTAAAAYYPYVAAAAAVAPPPVAADAVECEECEAAAEERRSPGFHWCVYDAVTVAFRSPVGPIERPPKRRVDA